MIPTHDYDHGRVILIFPADSNIFATSAAAEAYLAARGFSLGKRQRDDPRGIMLGEVRIEKWRNLRPIERNVLHGQLTSGGPFGPVVVEIYATAPYEAREAIVAAPDHKLPHAKSVRLIGRAAEAVIAALAVFMMWSIGYVGWHPVFASSQEPAAKIVMRAGPLGTREARR